jgi:hypothetical protein
MFLAYGNAICTRGNYGGEPSIAGTNQAPSSNYDADSTTGAY